MPERIIAGGGGHEPSVDATLSGLFEHAEVGVAVLAAPDLLTRVNPALASMLDATVERIEGVGLLGLVAPADRQAVSSALQGLEEGAQEASVEVAAGADSQRVLHLQLRASGEPSRWFATVSDVTADRRNEQFSRRQREVLDDVALGAPVHCALSHLVDSTRQWLPEAAATVAIVDEADGALQPIAHDGLSEEFCSQTFPLVVAEGNGCCGHAAFHGEPVLIDDVTCDERMAPFQQQLATEAIRACWSMPFADAEGRVLGVFTLYPRRPGVPDELARRMLEDAARLCAVAVLRERIERDRQALQERYRAVAGATADLVYEWEVAEQRLWFTETLADALGYEAEGPVVGTERWEELIHPADRAGVKVGVAASMRSDDTRWEREYRLRHRDGRYVPVLDRGMLLRDEHGRVTRVIGGLIDLTERRELEEQALRAQRLESLGTLAGGMAHDLNNVLTPILMSVQLLGRDERDETGRELIDAIERSAQRGRRLVKQVLEFARGRQHRERTPVDVAELVDDALGLAGGGTHKRVDCRVELPEHLPATVGDHDQLLQGIFNVVLNAYEAMASGGVLTVRAWSGGDPERPTVELEVADTGPGIDEADQTHVFDPFFSLKGTTHTGLGLSIATRVVHAHGGQIWVGSSDDNGTAIRFSLPSTGQTPAHSSAASRRDATARQASKPDTPDASASALDTSDASTSAARPSDARPSDVSTSDASPSDASTSAHLPWDASTSSSRTSDASGGTDEARQTVTEATEGGGEAAPASGAAGSEGGAPEGAEPPARMNTGPLVLLLEPEEGLRGAVQRVLEGDGRRVVVAEDLPTARRLAAEHGPRLDALIARVDEGESPRGLDPAAMALLTAQVPQAGVVLLCAGYPAGLDGLEGVTLVPSPFGTDELRRAVDAYVDGGTADR